MTITLIVNLRSYILHNLVVTIFNKKVLRPNLKQVKSIQMKIYELKLNASKRKSKNKFLNKILKSQN